MRREVKLVYILLFILILVPCIGYINQNLDNDFYFIYLHGKRIMSEGFFKVDNLTIHNGLNITVQQWLTAVLFFNVYNLFGKLGINILLIVVHILICIVLLKIYMEISEGNLFISLLILAMVSVTLGKMITSRPLPFTLLMCVCVVFIMNRYVKTNNSRWLALFCVISWLEINLHAAMWIFVFFPILPFLVANKTSSLNRMKYSPCNKRRIILYSLLGVICGFLNPYGYKSVTYLIGSVNEASGFIQEMRKAQINNITGLAIFFISIFVFFLIIKEGGEKVSVNSLMFFIGGIALASYALKCLPFFVIYTSFILVELLRDFDFSSINIFQSRFLSIMLTVIILTYIMMIHIYSVSDKSFYTVYRAIDFLDEYENDKSKPKVYTSFDNGNYAEYRGFKTYIDARMEVFVKSKNGKEDIWYEYIKLQYREISVDYFLEKYDFDYVVVDKEDVLYSGIKEFENYKEIYNKSNVCIYRNTNY